MSLTAADIAEILRLVEESTFDEFSLEHDGLKLNFKRTSGSAEPVSVPDEPTALAAAPTVQPAAHAPAPVVDPRFHEVRAPMLGTFYRAPKPGEPPYVEVGATVDKESIVGIIEVMKLMNTVRAGVNGIVAELPIADGALVEYGEVILRVQKPA